MKAFSFSAVVVGVLLPFLTLPGCGNDGTQMQRVSTPARDQVSSSESIGTETGKKKGGPYWWIWVSAKVPPGASHTFLAYCPKDYVVTGGGYNEGAPGPWNVDITQPHLPDLRYWILVVNNNNFSFSGRMTEYAVCAPATSSGDKPQPATLLGGPVPRGA